MIASKPCVLIVDDDHWVLDYLTELLGKEGYSIYAAETAEDGIRIASQYDCDLVLCDVRMEGHDGIELLQRVRAGNSPPEVIMITGHATIDGAVEAMKHEAFDYLTKPFDEERVLSSVRRALERRALVTEVKTLRSQMLASHGDDRLVVVSQEMRSTMTVVEAASGSDTTVLIEGESGTGKEIIARTIHRRSARARGPFVPVNCGALPESLLESELFGYERGAFTGATSDKKGLFESAEGGTIFLDEISELPLHLQAALLRVLQEGEVRRVGGTSTRRVDARVVAATNRALHSMVESGSFRQDLYYRFRVVPIVVPPLRARKDDIMPLARFFLDEYGRRFGKSFQSIEPRAAQFLLEYDWPGNVRELENLIQGVVTLFTGEQFTYSQIVALMPSLDRRSWDPATSSAARPISAASPAESLAQGLDSAERRAIEDALKQCQGNQTAASKALGISRTSLWRKMKKYGLEH
jgi:DNA-binding NtrC family response regulator